MSKRRTNAAEEVLEEAKVEEVKTEEAVTVEKPAAVGKTETEIHPKMYVGPTITDFAIQNRVYTGMPEAAKKKVAEMPELNNLFIEVIDYPKANKMLRERSGYIYSAYVKALGLRK